MLVEDVADRLEVLLREKAEELSVGVEHLAIRPDHLHMFVHDRDLNASRNILAEGMRVLAAGQTDNPNARGEPVRLPTGSAAR